MAATKTLQDSINWVQPFLNWASLTIGTNLEPALTSANQTLQTIVGPPFKWSWNRAITSFLTTNNQQDYNIAIANFGYLETASIQLSGTITSVTTLAGIATYSAINGFGTLDNGGLGQLVTVSGCTTSGLNGTFTILSIDPAGQFFTTATTLGNFTESEAGALAVAGHSVQLELKWEALEVDRGIDRPTFIGTQSSDESGVNFTFRLMPVPGIPYRVNLTYQESPGPAIVRTSDTWGIPDQLQYIYNYFFAFFMFDYFEDPRAARYRQLAVASLLARQSGLSATDRNLFLGNWMAILNEETTEQGLSQAGNSGRGI
jgi:hypothetical protein